MESGYMTGSPGLDIATPAYANGNGIDLDRGFRTPGSLSLETSMTDEQSNGSNSAEAFAATSLANNQARASRQTRTLPAQGHSTSSLRGATSPGIHPAQYRSSHSWQETTYSSEVLGSPVVSDVTSPSLSQGGGRMTENADGAASVYRPTLPEEEHRAPEKADMLPPWSELKTKAGKERKRLPLACIACRRKKIRCSGEKPACKHCLRSRIPCVYKVTTRKAAPRTDYMAMLDKRLKRMEDRVIKIIPREEQGIVVSTGRANVKPPIPEVTTKPEAAPRKRPAEQAFNHDLEEWANGNAEAASDRTGLDPQEKETKATGVNNEDNNLLAEGAESLPSRDVQEHLAEVFFDYVYGQSYHLLHKPSFMRKLAQGTIPPVLVLSVCAVSARFSSHPSVRTEPAFLRGESWAVVARKIALERYDTPNITILIVLLILGLHEFGTCQGGRSWMLGGMAQRMAYALRLHQDLDHDPKTSEGKSEDLTATDREIRRRTMWSCFLMDRFNSSGTDRPLFVAEQYIRAQLPIRESFFQMEATGPTEDLEGGVPRSTTVGDGQLSNAKTNMGVAAYLIRLVAIWGHLVRYLNLGGREKDSHPLWDEASTFRVIQKSVEAWSSTLPESLTYDTGNLANHVSEKTANQFIFMHIVYHQIILFMNRFALPSPGSLAVLPRDMPADFIQKSSKAALDAANSISALVHEGMDHAVVAPFAGYCAFYSSTVHINGAFSKNAGLEASSKLNLARNVKYLTKMKKYWGMFHYMTENLRDLYRRHADAARNGASVSSTSGAAHASHRIFQYGDWFDRYPHGVSGTDYDEPSAKIKTETGADGVLGPTSDLQTVEEFFSRMIPPSQVVGPGTVTIGQQPSGRKKKRTKSQASRVQRGEDSSVQADTTEQRLPQDIPPPTITESQNPGYSSSGNVATNRPMDFNDQMLVDQPLIDEPFDYTQYRNVLQANYPQPLLNDASAQFMSQVDRQLVLSSYGGIDAVVSGTAATTGNSQVNISTIHSTFDPFGLDAFSSSNHPNGAGVQQQQQVRDHGPLEGEYWGDPSTAWFMPFNVEPPSVREETDRPFSGLHPIRGVESPSATPSEWWTHM